MATWNQPFGGAGFAASITLTMTDGSSQMISVIATVLNEGDSIHLLLNSMGAQTRQPDEIVIVDGGSADDTCEIIAGYSDRLPVRVLVEPGCNISQGRNRAIEAASGDIIAVTDAGVRLSDTWLEAITEPLLFNPDLNGVAGFFLADPQTPFEVALGATTLPLRDEIRAETFLPSSRSIAFRRSAAREGGGYPEWLDYCEDLVFDLRFRSMFGPFAFEPAAVVYFRPRPSIGSFYRQYFLYARGDGKADLWLKRHAIRYAAYWLLAPSIFLLGALLEPFWWGLYLPGAAYYLYQPYRRLPVISRRWRGNSVFAWLYCIFVIPVLRVVGDIAKMHGYPGGRLWRWRHRPPDWRL
ncbi:MAG: glycosyltransferase [Chloroflexi bacterium]|nr:glycosyltransferase [Chloroflexota bacterium]